MIDAHGPTETEMVFQIKMINAQMKTVVLLTMDVQISQLLLLNLSKVIKIASFFLQAVVN